MTEDSTQNRVERWIREIVIGYNLCPFAKTPMARGKVELIDYREKDLSGLQAFILTKAGELAGAGPEGAETSLIICPFVLGDFLSYWDYSGMIEEALAAAGLEGHIQLATFHPQYRFAGTDADAPENYTNRAPYPIFQLIKESSVERALMNFPNPEAIPQRNIEKMRSLGFAYLQKAFERY